MGNITDDTQVVFKSPDFGYWVSEEHIFIADSNSATRFTYKEVKDIDPPAEGEWVPSPERHYIVSGHIPGDDESAVAHVVVVAEDTRDAWQVFVEEVLYDSSDTDLPENWCEEDPSEEQNSWGSWAYHNADFEIPGPPLDTTYTPD